MNYVIAALFSVALITSSSTLQATPANLNKVDSRAKAQAVQAKPIENWPQGIPEDKALTEPQTISPEPALTFQEMPEVSELPTPTPESPAAQPTPVFQTGSPDEMMAQAGIDQNDWAAVDYIVSHESGWNPTAVNPTSGSCGLVQELPCGKSGCTLGDGICELRWATSYAVGTYGSWWSAEAFWQAHSWW